MAVDHEPSGIKDRLEELEKTNLLFTVSDKRLFQAATDPSKPLRLEDLTHANLIRQALTHPDTVDIVAKNVTSMTVLSWIASKLKERPLKHKKGTIRVDKLLALQLVDAVYQLIEQQPQIDIRATAIGALMFAVDLKDQVFNKGETGFELPWFRPELETYGRHITKLAKLPPDLSGPEHCVDLMTKALAASDINPAEQRIAIGVMGSTVRDQMCRQRYGQQYDGYAVEEYRAAALVHPCDDGDVRLSLLNEPSMFIDINKHPLWLEYSRLHEFPETGVDDYPLAVLDAHHPQHARARRIFRVYLAATHPAEHGAFITNMAAFGSDITEVKDNATNLHGIKQSHTIERLRGYQREYDQIYGTPGTGILEKTRRLLLYALSGDNPEFDWRKSVSNISPKESIRMERIRDQGSGQYTFRAVDLVSHTDERLTVLTPELNVEQRTTLETICQALAADIQESTVALPPKYLSKASQVLRIEPVPEHFPALCISLSNEDIRLEIELDEKLAVKKTTTTARTQDVLLVVRALALAIVHDQVLTVQQVQYGSRKEPLASPKPAVPPAPDEVRPTRIHQSKNYIVIGERPESSSEVTHTVTATNDNGATITVDRRPHWSDRAPQLTRDARRSALERWLATTDSAVQACRPVLEAALLHDYAHRLTIRRILEGLFTIERRGKKILPTDFPLQAAIDQLTTLTDEHYQQLLTAYEAAGRSASPLPNIYAMNTRMREDRAQMKALGIAPMSIPPRMRETETYMPFSRYQAPIKFNSSGVSKIKHYTILRGESALDMVQKILAAKQTE